MNVRSRYRALVYGLAASSALLAGAARAQDAEPSITLSAAYTSDTFANVRGGLNTGLRHMGLAEVSAEADLGRLGLDGGRAFAGVQHVHGKSLSGDLVGDAQVISNIDAPDGLRLFEAWVSIPLAKNGTVTAGLIDLNGIFDVQEVGSLFTNSSHGIGPDFSQSGLNGPSIFPTTSAAVVAEWEGDSFVLRTGIFDAVAGDPERPRRTVFRLPGETGLLVVGEGEIQISKYAQVQIGAWTYTSSFDALDQDPGDDADDRVKSRGAYAMIEGRLASPGGRPLDGWVRVGRADPGANAIETYFGGGVALGREGSRWGVAVGHARLGAPARDAAGTAGKRSETSIELTYARAVGKYLTLQPTLHYVINPGWDRAHRSALVGGVRVALQL